MLPARCCGRMRWLRWLAVCGAVVLGVQLLPPGARLPGLGPGVALASPPAPPAPVNPAPRVVAVTTPGPTQVSSNITADTVWSPQGSPYVITQSIAVPVGVELTLLPGTVVKLEGSSTAINVFGELLSAGDPADHVVITSYHDDSVMGDTDGDGGATSPAPGDWYSVDLAPGAVAVFDYTDVRYGGLGSACYAYGEINGGDGSQLVISNSSVTDSQNAAVIVGTSYKADAGIYNSYFARSCMGVAATQPRELDLVGNTFSMPSGDTAIWLLNPQQTRVWFNTVNGLSKVYGQNPVTRAMADIRFNQLSGVAAGSSLNDWSDNWWGVNANSPLPACMDPNVAASSVPQVSVSGSSSGCPAGQYQVTGYTYPVLPALSASPQVLPASVREAAAPRFGPVDTYSGALTYQAADLSVTDAGKTISETRTYRSDRLSGGDAGPGWTTSFDEALSASGGTATLSMPDGSGVPFPTDPAAGYTPAPGVTAGYTANPDGSATVTSPGQVAYQFDPSGQLTGMNLGDLGHHLTIARSGGHVSKVTGVSGRYLSYAYDGGGNLSSVADNSGRQVSFTYNSGQLASATGTDGQAESYSYDPAGRLTQVTEPDGLLKLSAGYDSDGRVAWIQQAGGGKVTFGYDDADAERTITLPDGTVITQLYDWAGRLVSERLGSAGTHVVYDGEGRVVASITGIPGTAMTGYAPPASVTMYNGQGDPYCAVDPDGNATLTTFNSMHEPLVTTRPDGSTISRTYDGNGRLTKLIDPRGNEWDYTYNSLGEVTSQTDPLGRTRATAYASNGDATSLTDETGAVTLFGYDTEGRRTSVTDPLGNETDTTYTAWDAVATVTSPRGGVTSYSYDTDRRLTSVTSPLTAVISYAYDSQGRLATTTDPLSGKWALSYDTLGRPIQMTDPLGATYQRTYTAEGWVATSTNPDGKVTSYAYDPAGRVIRVTDPVGAVTQTVWDRAGHVTEVDRPDGSVQAWAYDSLGRLVKYTLPNGGVQTTAYDASGNVTSVTGPDLSTNMWPHTVVTATWDAAGRLASVTDAAGTTTTYAYSDATRTVTTTDPLGTAGSVTYDAAGQVASRTDGAGGTTSYGYDGNGNLTSVTDPTSRKTTYSYNLGNKLTSQADPAGNITSYAYDLAGQLAKVTYPAGDTQAYTYDAAGHVTGYRDRDGNSWAYTYDPAGRLLTATDPLSHVTTWTYDADGRQASVTDPAGVVWNTAYDPVGRPAVTWDAAGAGWVTSYDLDGNIVKTTDPDGLTWAYGYNKADELTSASWGGQGAFNYSYDAAGRLTEKDDPYKTTYGYNARGQATTVTDAYGNATSYGYDGAGRVTSVTLPSGNASTASYDAAGRIAAAADGAGDTSHYGYNSAGLLATITLPRGGQYSYSYDADGRLASRTDPVGGLTGYAFDGNGLLTAVTWPDGHPEALAYDAAGRLTSDTAAGVTRSYGYDNAGRLTSATLAGQPGSPPALSWAYNNLGEMTSGTDGLGTTGYGYDPAHRLITRTPPAGTAATYSYNNQGLPSAISGPVSVSMSYTKAGQLNAVFARGYTPQFSYDSDGRITQAGDTGATYNADGRIATLSQSPPGNPAGNTTTFTYDKAGRLATAALARNGTTVSTATYGWDADSNRTSVAITGLPTVTTSYNLADQATSDSGGDTYAYDPNGNLTTFTTPGGTTSYGYDPFGELTSTAVSGSASYVPDALGRLAARTSAGSDWQFSYDGTGTQPAAQQSGGSVTSLVRDPSGRLLAEVPANGDPLLVFPDIHGDITRLSDMITGAATWTGVYDPFGADTTTGAAPVSLGFQSMYADPATGLIDMVARWYNPAGGTFTSMDTIAGNLASPPTLNRYLYGTGDPADSYDPTGHCSWLDLICEATQAWDSVTSWASQTWNTATAWASQTWNNFTSDITQTYASVTADLATAYHQASQELQASLPTIKATAAALVVGGTVFLGCEALTAGVGSIGCAASGGAAGGAVYGAMMCPQGSSTLRCAATGALAGTVAGATAGVGGELGLGAAATGALAAGTGNAASQYLATGHVNPGQVAAAALTGAALGYAGSKALTTADALLGRLGTSVLNGDTTTSADTTPLAQPAPPAGDTTAPPPATPADGTADPAIGPSTPVPEGAAPETFFRTMSKANFDQLQATGRVPATSETFVSPSQGYAQGYEGVTVRFSVRAGTQDALAGVGVRDASAAASAAYPDMPLVSSGWTSTSAFFKGEGGILNIGLGRGPALGIFNDSILGFEVVP